MYQLGYRCDVTGATLSRPLPKRMSICRITKDIANVELSYRGNATSQMMLVTVQSERSSLITGYKPSKS
jgi:hypothetical protein